MIIRELEHLDPLIETHGGEPKQVTKILIVDVPDKGDVAVTLYETKIYIEEQFDSVERAFEIIQIIDVPEAFTNQVLEFVKLEKQVTSQFNELTK